MGAAKSGLGGARVVLCNFKRPKPNGIIAMRLMPTNGYGITSAGMKFQKASQVPIPWKQIMLNSVTT